MIMQDILMKSGRKPDNTLRTLVTQLIDHMPEQTDGQLIKTLNRCRRSLITAWTCTPGKKYLVEEAVVNDFISHMSGQTRQILNTLQRCQQSFLVSGRDLAC